MLDLNLFSQMGLLVLGGPMLLMGLASFGVAGIAYGVRTLRHQQGWSEGPARPMVFPGHAADAGWRCHRRPGAAGIDGIAVVAVLPRDAGGCRSS